MGGGVSTNQQKIAEKYLASLEAELSKPQDASDVQDFDQCKQELINLRGKIKSLVTESKMFLQSEETLLRDSMTKLLQCAMEVEKTVTPFLTTVAGNCKGSLVGLQHRFKARHSLERKVRADIDCKKRALARGSQDGSIAVDIPSIVQSMGDALRYTMLIPEEDYCAVVLNTRKVLEEMGNPAIKFKNYWEKGDMYQGINDNYLNSETNFIFELQFHTQASWDLKALCHVIYEKFRICRDPVEQQKLFDEGVQLALSLPLPKGIEEIPKLVRNPEPNILSAYSQLIYDHGKCFQSFLQSWFTTATNNNNGNAVTVSVEVDNEKTIQAELSALVDQKNKAVNQIVQDDYFYAIMVKIVVTEKTDYTPLVKQVLAVINASQSAENTDPSQRIECRQIVNQWTNPETVVNSLRLMCCLGSKATPYPADNILFEVAFHTKQSNQIIEDIQMLLHMESNLLTERELCSKVNHLWKTCDIPDQIEEVAGTSS